MASSHEASDLNHQPRKVHQVVYTLWNNFFHLLLLQNSVFTSTLNLYLDTTHFFILAHSHSRNIMKP